MPGYQKKKKIDFSFFCNLFPTIQRTRSNARQQRFTEKNIYIYIYQRIDSLSPFLFFFVFFSHFLSRFPLLNVLVVNFAA